MSKVIVDLGHRGEINNNPFSKKLYDAQIMLLMIIVDTLEKEGKDPDG